MRNVSAVPSRRAAPGCHGWANAPAALAHKSKKGHTHCTVEGKGVEVEGKTDAEKKTACGKLANSKWDEKKDAKVEMKAAKDDAKVGTITSSAPGIALAMVKYTVEPGTVVDVGDEQAKVVA